MAAWRGFDGFHGRAALRAWLARGKAGLRRGEPRPGGRADGGPAGGLPEVPRPRAPRHRRHPVA